MSAHVARMDEGRSAFKSITGKPTRESLGVDGRTILECAYQYVELGDLIQDRDYWRALVKAASNLRVP